MITIDNEIFELGSYLLYGHSSKIIFDYNNLNMEFPHDEFHCVIQAETDLYDFYEKNSIDKKSEDILTFEFSNGIFITYNQDNIPIYATYRTKGMTEDIFSNLNTSIQSYLESMHIEKRKIFINGNGNEFKKEDLISSIEETRALFSDGLTFLNESKLENIKKEIRKRFDNADKKDYKTIFRSLLHLYHPDKNQININEATEITQVIIKYFNYIKNKAL